MNSVSLNYNPVVELSSFKEFELSPSKSLSQRVLIISYLRNKKCDIKKLSNSDDTAILDHALFSRSKIINLQQSGSALRFLITLFAYENREVVIVGHKSLMKRPVANLISALNNLGANIVQENDKIIVNKGNLIGGTITFNSSPTSQFISSLLLVSPYIPGGITLKFAKDIYSKSYINMTTDLMRSCGAKLKITSSQVKVHEHGYSQIIDFIESDWTSASYLFLAFLFSNFKTINIKSLNKDSLQADSVIIDFFSLFGVLTTFNNNTLILEKVPGHILPKKIHWNFDQTPDLFPSILIACFACGVEFVGRGVETLVYKESNRLLSMKNELLKLNGVLKMHSSNFVSLKPTLKASKKKFTFIETYNDHRIALSFSTLSVLGLKLTINNPNVINKSYPDFFNDLIKFGVVID